MTFGKDVSDFYNDTRESVGFKIFVTFTFLILGVCFLVLIGILMGTAFALLYHFPSVFVPVYLLFGVITWTVVHIDRKARRK